MIQNHPHMRTMIPQRVGRAVVTAEPRHGSPRILKPTLFGWAVVLTDGSGT